MAITGWANLCLESRSFYSLVEEEKSCLLAQYGHRLQVLVQYILLYNRNSADFLLQKDGGAQRLLYLVLIGGYTSNSKTHVPCLPAHTQPLRLHSNSQKQVRL